MVLAAALIVTMVFAQPPLAAAQQAPNTFNQLGWISKDTDPGPPPPSNYYPHPKYIAPRVQPPIDQDQQPDGYPGPLGPIGYGFGYNFMYPPLYYGNQNKFFYHYPG